MKMRKEFTRAIRNGHYEKTDDGILLPRQGIMLGGVFEHDVLRDGKLLGAERDHNLVVDEALNIFLDSTLSNGTQYPNWYLGLFSNNTYTPANTDTGANIVSRSTEVTATYYSGGQRPQWVDAGPSSKTITNSASVATFNIIAGVTVYGAWLISTNTISDTAGKLCATSKFTTSRVLVNADKLLVTYTITSSDVP